ncbi:MAG: BamA/TamA family outer membrane protein [Gracilimonas sp.]|uniref:BamA/OMP85 family outer membrane protein n=1 Tax=Gracilimonas sp. TaxID=1974203 RepID=UPI0019CDD7C8|nr:BamA/TamA family outer membrane protein [Gracilimonas sp.]MBD3616980.1 BamA/TamA family outer membrane protein [Gracilimonas sp.]
MALAQEDLESTRVWKVKIEGNETFEGIVLRNVITNEAPSLFKKLMFWRKPGMRLNENDVRRDVIRIERFYQRRGFNDVQVSYRIEDLSKEWRKTVIFEIIENSPIQIKNVRFEIVSSQKDSTLITNSENVNSIKQRLPYREGRRYETVNQSEVEGSLVGALRNLGYPYANSEVYANIDSTSKTAEVILRSTPGPRARFDSVLVEGHENLPAKYIARETGIKQNNFFSEKQLREAQREVFNHHMLRFALVSIPDQPKDSLINIKVRVKESPLRSLQLLFGIGNLTRIENGWADFYKLFRGQASWTHRNVRNRGERFTISGNASAIEQRLGIDYLFPYLLNTKTSLVSSPFISHQLEPSYEILRGGFTNSFVYQYSSNFTGTVSYEYTLNNETTTSSQESLPDSIQSYNVSSFNLNAFYSKGLSRGQEGWSFQPFWELSGLFGESTYSFQEVGLDARKFTPLTDKIVFAKRINFAGIYYAKQDSLPSDIRIYNGGTNSVRGWNRQELGPKRPILDEEGDFSHFVPIGGRATISFNTEFRFQLNQLIKGFGVATFLDGGQVWSNFNDIGTTPIQWGVGGGLRYQSPIGPIRVDIAYKINPTDQDLQIYQGQNYGSAWDKWGIHFSIGQAF